MGIKLLLNKFIHFRILATGGDVRYLRKEIGNVFTLEEIEEALKEHKPSVMFITHGESSGGVLQPLEGMGPLCHK